MTLNVELQKSDCPTGRQFKSYRDARIDNRWYQNDVTLVWEVQCCSGLALRDPTTELSYSKRRKQWAIIRIR